MLRAANRIISHDGGMGYPLALDLQSAASEFIICACPASR